MADSGRDGSAGFSSSGGRHSYYNAPGGRGRGLPSRGYRGGGAGGRRSAGGRNLNHRSRGGSAGHLEGKAWSRVENRKKEEVIADHNAEVVADVSSSSSVASCLSSEGDIGSVSAHLGSGDLPVEVKTTMDDGLNLGLGNMNIAPMENECELPLQSTTENQPSLEKCPDDAAKAKDSQDLEQLELAKPFDICPPKSEAPFKLKPSLFESNREKRSETKHAIEGQKKTILRTGMVLLQNYLSMRDQVKIVKQCQRLGLGPGGFYQPGYRDGAKLHLKMMCLGRHWDCETGMYGEHRPFDDAKPPIIPPEFRELVEKALKDSGALSQVASRSSSVEGNLPWMSPDICIVNFYSKTGRLGLHQDKDESEESLRKGLPVVSFSIGDAGEFLYSDQRDAEKADRILLNSGDVLIFGGKSRHIFHGVSQVQPESAPKSLLEETNLRAGRLNLTFRQY